MNRHLIDFNQYPLFIWFRFSSVWLYKNNPLTHAGPPCACRTYCYPRSRSRNNVKIEQKKRKSKHIITKNNITPSPSSPIKVHTRERETITKKTLILPRNWNNHSLDPLIIIFIIKCLDLCHSLIPRPTRDAMCTWLHIRHINNLLTLYLISCQPSVLPDLLFSTITHPPCRFRSLLAKSPNGGRTPTSDTPLRHPLHSSSLRTRNASNMLGSISRRCRRRNRRVWQVSISSDV